MKIQPGMAAFVTGAAGGMGLAMAGAFATAGLRLPWRTLTLHA